MTRIIIPTEDPVEPKKSAKNDPSHVATTTEYVLVYAMDSDLAKTNLLKRTDKSNARFHHLDNDKNGRWKQGDATARDARRATGYAIQSPFTGEMHYPGKRHWSNAKEQMREWLAGWGHEFEERDLKDGFPSALVLKGWRPDGDVKKNAKLVEVSSAAARSVLQRGNWPRLYFGMKGDAQPVLKVYERDVKIGVVPMTFWDEDFYEDPYHLGSVAWSYGESGRSRDGTEELRSTVDLGQDFETVKPLKLIKKIITLWGRPGGYVFDPYAGSGTTGHAVLELNQETDGNYKFILVEQGSPASGDKYARSLTHQRLKNVITGQRYGAKGVPEQVPAIDSGFEFRMLTTQIDAKTVLSMRRDELIDVVMTSHWDSTGKQTFNLIRIDGKYRYLVGRNSEGEGYFLIWDGDGPVGQLDSSTFKLLLAEAKAAGLAPPYHVYARYEVYQSPNVIFYKIPDKILSHLGLNESNDSFNPSGGS